MPGRRRSRGLSIKPKTVFARSLSMSSRGGTITLGAVVSVIAELACVLVLIWLLSH
jgi:hypothetical protein